MLNSFAQSHIGQRKVNEDSFIIDEDIGLYIVADGVGGLEKGEVASKIACEVVREQILSGKTLTESIYSAHRSIISKIKENRNKEGMATTIVAVLFNENAYEVAWVGDSRLYLWDNELKLITKDDSYVELLLENGHINIEDLDTHPDRNVISQALGIERKEITISTNSGTLEEGQMLLLCTDGLYSIASERYIINELNNRNDVKEITQYLVNLAVEKEGKDNISLILIKSDTNSKTIESKKYPNIVREFDQQTGKILGLTVSQKQESAERSVEVDSELDPELVDQTTFTDMTAENRNLLDTAAREALKEPTSKNYFFPAVLVSIVVIATIILINYL